MLSPTPPIDRSNLRPGTGYFIAPRVPHGLATVVEGLAREVLRHRPEDIYVFAAHHFEKLLKLREEYHVKEYSNHEFDHEFSRDFNLWPTKETQNIGKLSNGWSLEKEIEKREQTAVDAEESQEDFSVSTDRENRKASRQTCSRDSAKKTTKKTSKRSKDNEITDARATRIISQMTALHSSGKNIQTKDIKQELRRNKLSGEKSKSIDSVEKGIRGDRRSRTRITKDKGPAEEIDRATITTTTSSSRTSARRPLKKGRRIETESETETEHEIAAKAGFEDRHARSNINDGASREATRSRERRPEARLSEHSSERKVSSRALSMDRIRAYVLRKFASTASLEVLRSPTYVEQVQEVIDRAAPIIKEKLEEIGREKSRGKRSKSVDLAWNNVSLQRHIREEKRHGDEEENERRKSGNGLERKTDIMKREEMKDSLGWNEMISTVEREEKKLRRRSVGSGKRSRRRESGDFAVVDQVDDNSKHSNKLEHESDATRDTLEARLTATQSILEGISKSTSELGGVRKNDFAGLEPLEPEISDHIVSLPVVRPPSSRNSRSATKNGSDSLTLPPISPELPKSTKKKDELSLPVLPTAANDNHSDRKPQEQDVSKDVEEASTMHDITSDIEDIAVLSENSHENVDVKQDPDNDCLLSSNVRFINEEECGNDKNMDKVFDETRGSLEKFEELEKLEEGRRSEEIFRDSLNVTPEVADVPLRPDSLEPDEDEVKLQNDADSARENTFDRLKDKLIEIEMAERSIEKALASQQATCDIGEMTNQAEKLVTDGKINEAEESTNEAEETVNEIRKSTDAEKIPINKDEEKKKNNDEGKRKSTNDIEEIKYEEISHKTEDLNIEEKLTNKSEKMESEIKRLTNETENSKNKANEIKKSMNENEAEGLKNKVKIKNGVEKITDQTEITTKTRENAQDEKQINETEKLINEKLSNGVEELAVKTHVENVQSINPRSYKDFQITEVVEMDGDNTVTSKKETENATNGFFKSTTSGNAAITNESSIANLSNENGRTKARKKRESDNSLLTTPLSLELPFSYVLSEGSPCEIPDSVTTVIIPDKSYSFPVTMDRYPLESTNQKEESRFDMAQEVSKDESQEKDQHECDMEVFGEYIRPEILPVDTDYMCGVEEIKSNQDLAIVHQDLDRIKEEGEEEEGKENDERKETEKKKNDKEEDIKEEEMKKIATLKDIVEHEENEETDVRTIGSKNTEEISSSGVLEYESLPDIKDLTVDAVLTNTGGADVAIESRSLLDNSSEESGSTQGTHTTTSSDVKESTTSNQSIESPSPDRPVVPELNLDSLQDNTVSSFKMTANGTEKEDNGSLRESDATISLVEPLVSDERLMNQPLTLADHKEEIVAEELTERNLQSEVPEADQLYHAEHVEYEWLEKDPLSTEINLEDEIKSQENSIDLKTLPENDVDSLLQEKAETEELGSEEEIARELIGLLDKDLQLRAEELDSKKESIDSGESEKNNLKIDDKFNQPLSTSMHSMSVEQEKREHENFVDKIDKVVKTETISELSSDVIDISQDKSKNSAIIDKETEKLEIMEEAHIENSQVAPLAQFEQDELLEENDRSETADEKLIVKNKPKIINADYTDIQEKLEDKQTSIEEVSESQSSDSKIEEPNKTREETEQEELQNQEKREQEKLEAHEECKQEKLDVQKEIEQEKLKIQGKDNQEKITIEEKIVSVTASPLEVIESRKDSINESMKNDGYEKTKLNNESIIDDQIEKDAEHEQEEKSEDLSEKTEKVHGPITSAISEQSTEGHSRFGYWTTETKSSTVETVIEAFNSNTSTNEKMEIVADAPEIIADESLIRKKDDFHSLSAVVKIQSCIRGFLARRRVRRNLNSEFVSNSTPSAQKIVTSDRLMVPQDTLSLREARRLRREEALRNTTLSLENAFATGRLQHTSEFHDSVPLLPFDLTNNKIDSVTSNDSLNEEIDVEETNPPDIAKSSANESDPVEHGTNFRKGNAFVDPTFPIVMHLLTDASHNCHFAVSQNSRSDFNAGGTKPMDILMLGYPRDDENQYLKFITSVEDINSNMDSLTLDDMTKSAKNIDDGHPSTTSGEGSLREPLALPGASQGIVIEEVTSLDELVPSESTKPSTAPKTSLDTNSSMPSEECALENAKNDLGMSPRTTDATGDLKQGAERQESGRNSESTENSDLRSEDANKKANGISCDNREHVEEEKDEKI